MVIVRPFNAYGPREHESGDLAEVIPRFVIRVLNDLPPIIFGSGDNGRDFTYVTETAHGIALAADCDGLLGRIVNIAYGRMVSIREVANLVVRLCGRPSLAPVHIEPRPGDVQTLHADTTVAQKLLGFRAEIDFEQGLAATLTGFADAATMSQVCSRPIPTTGRCLPAKIAGYRPMAENAFNLLITGTSSGLGLAVHQQLGGVGFVRGIALDDASICAAQPFDAIIHCALRAMSPVTMQTCHAYLEDNFLLTEQLLDIPHHKFIYVSTLDVYPRLRSRHRRR